MRNRNIEITHAHVQEMFGYDEQMYAKAVAILEQHKDSLSNVVKAWKEAGLVLRPNAVKTLDDGRSYVKADRQVLEGDDPKQWGVQLQNYINSEIRKGNDIVLPTTDGGLVRLTERSAYKLADNKSTG